KSTDGEKPISNWNPARSTIPPTEILSVKFPPGDTVFVDGVTESVAAETGPANFKKASTATPARAKWVCLIWFSSIDMSFQTGDAAKQTTGREYLPHR